MSSRGRKPFTAFTNSSNLPDPQWYSQTLSAQGQQRLVIVSGQTARRRDGTYPESFAEQVRQAVLNLVEALKDGGASPQNIVKLKFYPVNWTLDNGEAFMKPILDLLIVEHGVAHRPLTTFIPVTQLAYPDAKFEIEAVALIGGASEPWKDPATSSQYFPQPTRVDVVVVGGGFSGLAAAYRCQRAGLKTVVLEAKNRIGGRSCTQARQSGPGVIELGATWINKVTQPEVFALTEIFGLETVEQYTTGDAIYQRADGTVFRGQEENMDRGPTEEDCRQEKILTEALIERPESVDVRRWDNFPKGEDVTVAEWARQLGCTGEHAQAVADHLCAAVVGQGSDVVGAHYFLDYLKSGLGYISLVTEGEMGAQSLKLKNGTSEIAYSLARALDPGSVLLNSSVDSILQHEGRVEVTTAAGATFKSHKVILANPTNTYTEIRFSPPLPRQKRALVSKTMPGQYAKVIVSYREPWWRNAGLVGKFTSLRGPICFSWDTSDLGIGQYSLALFVSGKPAERWFQLSALDQEAALLNHLAELVGPELAACAQDPLEINTQKWSQEEHIWGAPTSSIGPELLSKYGDHLRVPFLNIHFAGGETAFEWKGYLEGAVTAGYRAASEVAQKLHPKVKI